jgi:hypothetical protein
MRFTKKKYQKDMTNTRYNAYPIEKIDKEDTALLEGISS